MGPRPGHDVRLSKALSSLLRHNAQAEGLEMRPDGYVPLSDVLRTRKVKIYRREDVVSVVENNDKKRFSLWVDQTSGIEYIRANQGHSIKIGIDDDTMLVKLQISDQIVEMGLCVHGTYEKKMASILREGLRPMGRRHIHFAQTVPEKGEVISGMRRSCDTIIHVDIKAAIADGVSFYRSTNEVLLSPGHPETGAVDPRYFASVLRR